MFREYMANKRLVVLRFGRNQESIVSGQGGRKGRRRNKGTQEQKNTGTKVEVTKDTMNEKKNTKRRNGDTKKYVITYA